MAISEITDVRVPPQNLEAEQSVLGAILLDNAALNRSMEILSEEDFYRTAHKMVYRSMVGLSERNQPVDQITLTDYLRGTGELDQIGGASYIAELVQLVPSAANIRYHCQIVRDKSLLRGLVRTATDVVMKGYEGTTKTDELLEFAEREIFRLAQGHLGGTFAPVSSILQESIEIVDRLYSRQEKITGVPTGFDIDHLTAGLQPSDLIIIAGRPSMGKTSLALGMAEHAALHANAVVGIFSLEMSRAQLVLRMLSSQAHLDSHAVRTGQLKGPDWEALTGAASQLQDAKGKARRLKAEHGLDLLIIDYLQLMEGRGNSESRQQEISDISRALKGLAKELNIPVVALSQLSRAVENRKPPIPVLADLRESGAIEQDADIVMFIYREEVYDPETDEKGIAKILVRKHRNGPIGEISLQFHDSYAKFHNLAR
jgi:replicative DNA helicase